MIAQREASNAAAARPPWTVWPLRLASLLTAAAALLAAGCGPVRLVATSDIPTPLVVKIPVAVAVSMPKEFSEYVHKEERAGTNWEISLGKAQSEGLARLLTAMFDHVIPVDGINAGAAQAGQGIRAILEPNVEEYAFVTPRDAGSPFYAVSIKYRLNIYTPEGRLADSWSFTGYGTAPAQGMSSDAPLNEATSLALRDAGAKLAVEFREQAIVRGLIPETAPQSPLPLEDTTKPAVTTAPQAAPAADAKPGAVEQPATPTENGPASAPEQGAAPPDSAQPGQANPEPAKPEQTNPRQAEPTPPNPGPNPEQNNPERPNGEQPAP